MIIGITGTIGSGKDTVAKMIQYYFYLKNTPNDFPKDAMFSLDEFFNRKDCGHVEQFSNWKIKKFAGKLKQIAALLVGCTAEDFESEEFKNSVLPNCWQDEFYPYNKTKRTYRNLLQQLGTEAIREKIHKESWVNALFADYKAINIEKRADIGGALDYSDCSFPNWIISDLRFLNEAQSIKDRNGLILRLIRGAEKESDHISEIELQKIKYDWIINNDSTLEVLYTSVEKFLNHHFK